MGGLLPLFSLLLSTISTIAESRHVVFPAQIAEEDRHGSYMVVAPRTLHPGFPYSVSVTLIAEGLKRRQIDASENLVILEIQESHIPKAIAWIANLVPGKPATVTIRPEQTSRLLNGRFYHLSVQGTTKSGILFESVNNIKVRGELETIFVQTDKAQYKPGSTVQFRSLVLNPELKPYQGNLTVTVKDPNRHVLKLYEVPELTKGCTTQQFQLSSEPPKGAWQINVETGTGATFVKTFTVAKYVLPKFEVKIEPPEFVQIPDDVPIKVVAKYTYGKGIAGKVTVTPISFSRLLGPVQKTVTLNEDGEATVMFRFVELFQRDLISGYGDKYFVSFLASVTEKLTGKVINATGTATLNKHGVDIHVVKPREHYKPGLPYLVMLAVQTPDGKPVPTSFSRVLKMVLTYQYQNDSKQTMEKELELGGDATILTDIQPPINTTNIRIQTWYNRKSGAKNAEFSTRFVVYPMKSPSNNFIQLSAPDISGKYNPGEKVEFTLTSTEKLSSVTMQILSRGSVILSRAKEMVGVEKNLSFEATTEMSPKAKLVVYRIRGANQEVLVDTADFQVEGFFKNNVSVEFNRKSAKPAESVEVKVRADPDSFVGLMAVDKSVYLLKGGFDIDQSMVESAVIPQGFMWSGTEHAEMIFQNADLHVITDAWLYDGREPISPDEPSFGRSFDDGVFFDPEVEGEYESAEQSLARTTAEDVMQMDSAPEREPISVSLRKQGLFRNSRRAAAGRPTSTPLPKVRTKFPETWMWLDMSTGANGEVVHRATVPDTITSWTVSAFAVNDKSGLGIATTKAKLQVFQPFFVTLNLPYSVKRLEKLALQVLVFNYDNKAQTVTVTLNRNENSSFDFVMEDGGIQDKQLNNTRYNVKRVEVSPGVGVSVFFPIVPTKVGKTELFVQAIGSTTADSIKKKLLVEPEGFRVDMNKALMLNLSEGGDNEITETIKMDFPKNRIEGSEWAQVSVIGDIMGPVLQNADDLVRMPYGCGEQNMVNFVPTVVVARYLTATERFSDDLADRARAYMEAGYQRQLSYMRHDNSFSAFGNSDSQGSTFLTAFVARSFSQARPYIYIDKDVLTRAIRYLKNQQRSDGSFIERGMVHDTALKGGASQSGVAMTSYVLIAMLMNEEQNTRATKLALKYIQNHLKEVVNDSYSLAIAAYALQLVNSPKKQEAFELLEKRAVESNGLKRWNATSNKQKPRPWYWFRPRALAVETTAYALLTYVARGDLAQAAPIVRWLVSQQNSFGGYSSTQDTVMVLQAFGVFAEQVYSPDNNLVVGIANGDDKHIFMVTPDNSIVLQQYELPNKLELVELSVNGTGVVFAKVSWFFHLTPGADDPQPFLCTRSVDVSEAGDLSLSICCKYNEKGRSNMAVMEVSALSGYQMEEEELEKLSSKEQIQRVELKKQDTQAVLYFAYLDADPVCVDLSSTQVFQVSDKKPARIVLYDYYETESRVELEYTEEETKTLKEKCPTCWADLLQEEAEE